ncbi:hypothetical protein JJQ58_10460 [Mammaliicoccus fleurettii]|uniref:YxeA family protein n=1 Tax=Mammaliicoccus fleurettii TaxID=150056 RepID=A0ABS5MPU0_9STAP|nr:hypothetical protein [Mammaliicoccus fleurettii]MBL0848348.1 hypothetical protein [Mammaliicoccus fleurettii]MBS3673087.1 hypothetical protein [Mammaliicoccus fleurettii]MBS3697887.1 hypothetical protein [Mammaliicoccus fleurettii]MEB7807313.1 hypothetical protein [Mammaliicoccus fleurettii]
MKKVIITTISILLLCIFSYLITSFQYLNRTEYYYGVVSPDNKTVKNLVSKESRMNEYTLTTKEKYKHGDIIRIKTTDAKGVILEVKKVSKADIPNKVYKRHYNQFE